MFRINACFDLKHPENDNNVKLTFKNILKFSWKIGRKYNFQDVLLLNERVFCVLNTQSSKSMRVTKLVFFAQMIPPRVHHFSKRTVWSLIYILIYAQSQILVTTLYVWSSHKLHILNYSNGCRALCFSALVVFDVFQFVEQWEPILGVTENKLRLVVSITSL